MKNSTLLRLFFISIGLPLTYASSSSTSSSSTSSTLTSKPKPKSKSKSKPKTTSLLVDTTTTAPAVQLLTTKPKSKSNTTSLLVDTTTIAPAVQLKDQNSLVQSAPEESQVSEKDERIKKLKGLISNGQYKKMSDEELLKRHCQEVTTLDQFKDHYEDLKQDKMVPDFLAHGDMAVVREVIVEADLLETDAFGKCVSIYDAITLSLKEGSHERVAGLFEAAQERPNWKHRFDWFVRGFFVRCPPEENSMPLKRFLALQRGEFGKEHPEIFETICEELVWCLQRRSKNPASHKLLIDLIGQPSLLTSVAFARGFLLNDNDNDRADFIRYGYREAIEEGLKEKCRGGGKQLWSMMVMSMNSRQFSGKFPSTDEARHVVLKGFRPTRQDLEKAWIEKNAPISSKLQEDDISVLTDDV